jgi:hypothetical protein
MKPTLIVYPTMRNFHMIIYGLYILYPEKENSNASYINSRCQTRQDLTMKGIIYNR